GLVIQSGIPGFAATPSVAPTATPTAPVMASAGASDEPIPGLRTTLMNPSSELAPTSEGKIRGWTPRGAVVELIEGAASRGAHFIAFETEEGPYAASLTSEPFRFDGG